MSEYIKQIQVNKNGRNQTYKLGDPRINELFGDTNGFLYVDLELPSGVLWAVRDSEKSYWDNAESEIHFRMGGSWRLPTREECLELLDNTTGDNIRISKINGNQIEFPLNENGGYYCNIWTSSKVPGTTDNVYILLLARMSNGSFYSGLLNSGPNNFRTVWGVIDKSFFYTKKLIDSKIQSIENTHTWKILYPVSILNITNWENIQKIIIDGKEYYSGTEKITIKDYGKTIYYTVVPVNGYGIVGGETKSLYVYGSTYSISLLAARCEYRIVLNDNVEKIIFDGDEYTESTVVYKPYTLSGNYKWEAVAKDGFGMIQSLGTVNGNDYTNGYTISPEAGQPTLNIQINEGVEKIVLNGTDEYTESLMIPLPLGSTVNYEVFYQEGYEAVPYSINWKVLTGTWNESEESEASDNKRFTCVSPGTNGMTKIRCTFEGLNSITFKFRSDAESTYDYLIMSKLDTDLSNITSWNASGVYSNSNVQDYTRGQQETWKEYTFSNLESGEHFVEFMFGKDSSQDTQPDNAQVYISNIE